MSYGAIRNAAIAVEAGEIVWVGASAELPGEPSQLADRVYHANGGWITPGLIDCHTHAVFGGNRIKEFEQRLSGTSYEELARAGGGILSTVRATRGATEEDLVQAAVGRLQFLLEEGVTTVEVKSGYGLDVATELKMLRAAREIANRLPMDVVTTYLAAHAVPPEFLTNRGGYLDLVTGEMLRAVVEEGLADAVDAFLEPIAFSREEVTRVFEAGRREGLPLRLHADQLSDGGGAQLAAEMGAASADHLEFTSDQGVDAMAQAGTVAVLLPGALHTLGSDRLPPVARFRSAGVPMALATDLNPGSSPVRSILVTLNFGCALLGLTPEEALAGVTRHAAKALGLDHDRGTLAVGKRADFVVWQIEEPSELAYWVGGRPVNQVVKAGVIVQ